MRARRTAIMAAALALSVSALGACSGQDEEQGPSGPPVTVTEGSEGPQGGQEAPEGDGGAPEADEPAFPRVGEGNAMLGVTDGVDRPEPSEIETADLEPTSLIEQGEKFRRAMAGDTTGDEWFAAVQPVADPSFAASLKVSDRDLLREAGKSATSVAIDDTYVLGVSNAPYASVTGSDDEGNELWTARFSFHPSKADPSIGTWRAVSIDWADGSEALMSDGLPFTEDTRSTVLTTASFASSSLFTQAPGDDEKARAELAESYFSAPEKAKKLPMPFPERNVTAVAGDPVGRYFVTPSGSEEIWVEVNNTSHVVSPSGDPDPDEPPKQDVVYVKLTFSDGNWVAVDAQKEKP